MINRIVTGMSAKQFRDAHGFKKGIDIRPYLTERQIEMMEIPQEVDVGLLVSVQDYQQRKCFLEWYKMKSLEKQHIKVGAYEYLEEMRLPGRPGKLKGRICFG